MLPATVTRRVETIPEVSRSGKSINGLFRLLETPALWMQAYQKIHTNKGAITPGVDRTTMDGFSDERVFNLIELLKTDRYRPKPVRRTYIPKGDGRTRPLGVTTGDDKLVQEVIRGLLERIYEPIFSDRSHGFRPKRSCHTALGEIDDRWTGVKWFVEADIEGFYNNLDHRILLQALGKQIEDARFLRLIERFLTAGYLEDWHWNPTYSGAPQGGIVSPILSNVYGRLFGRKGTVASMLPWIDGNPRPHSGMPRGQAQGAWSASRRQRDLCVGRRPARGRRVGENQKGKPVIGEDET